MTDERSATGETEANQDAPAIKFKKELDARQATVDASLSSLGLTDPNEIEKMQKVTRIANEYTVEAWNGGINIVTIGNRPVTSPEGSLLYSFYSYDKNNPKIGYSGIFELPGENVLPANLVNFDYMAHSVGQLVHGSKGPDVLQYRPSIDFATRAQDKGKGKQARVYNVDQHPDSLKAFASGWHRSINGVERDVRDIVQRRSSLNPVLEQTMQTVFELPKTAPVE